MVSRACSARPRRVEIADGTCDWSAPAFQITVIPETGAVHPCLRSARDASVSGSVHLTTAQDEREQSHPGSYRRNACFSGSSKSLRIGRGKPPRRAGRLLADRDRSIRQQAVRSIAVSRSTGPFGFGPGMPASRPKPPGIPRKPTVGLEGLLWRIACKSARFHGQEL